MIATTFPSKLNTGIAQVGGMVVGKIIPTTVYPDVGTVVGTIDLPAGNWILMAYVWLPEIITVQLSVKFMNTLGMLRVPHVVGYIGTKTQITEPLIMSHWYSSAVYVDLGAFIAVRI